MADRAGNAYSLHRHLSVINLLKRCWHLSLNDCILSMLTLYVAHCGLVLGCYQWRWNDLHIVGAKTPFLHFSSLPSFSPFHFPSLSHAVKPQLVSLSSSLTPPSLPLPFPQIQLGGYGSAVSSPSGSGQSPTTKRILMYFELKSTHLVVRNLVTVTVVLTLLFAFLSVFALIKCRILVKLFYDKTRSCRFALYYIVGWKPSCGCCP